MGKLADNGNSIIIEISFAGYLQDEDEAEMINTRLEQFLKSEYGHRTSSTLIGLSNSIIWEPEYRVI